MFSPTLNKVGVLLNRWVFQLLIFRYAYEIFRESIATMPARAVPLIYRIAVIFYFSWSGFGFFWLLSPAVRPPDFPGISLFTRFLYVMNSGACSYQKALTR